MKWFDRWFANKCKQAWYSEQERSDSMPKGSGFTVSPGVYTSNITGYTNTIQQQLKTKPLSVNIYDADGGKVVEFYSYDMHTDKYHSSLLVIAQGENFGERFEQVMAMHLLSKH